VSTQADENNPHVAGAFVGMGLVVEALKRCGPAPTRVCAKGALDTMELETGLGPKLKFTPTNHFSALCAQPFEAIYNQGTFSAWRYYKNTGFLCDDAVDKHQFKG
jgi:hypothetical protein